MMNPVLDESTRVYLRRKEYAFLHVGYMGVLALVTAAAWPASGYMSFFRLDSVPAVFDVVAIIELLSLSAISLFAGQDRLAASEIIRYSEWLERTRLPVTTLVAGKIVSALLHTVILVVISTPFVIVAAGPAGIPVRAALSSQWIVFMTALLCRTVGLLLSHAGEERYVVRVIGSWLFLALLYLVTIGADSPLNPLIALVRQYGESSPLVTSLDPLPIRNHPALLPTVYLLVGIAAATAAFAVTLYRHRSRAIRRNDGA